MKYIQQHMLIKSINDSGSFSGYASVFDELDGHGDIVAKGAFSRSLEGFRKSGRRPKLLWQHDSSYPIGIIDELTEDSHGLFLKAHLLLDLPKAREIHCLLQHGAIDGMSIGYRVKRQERRDNHNYLTELDLMEVSIVTFPACSNAVIDQVQATDAIKLIEKGENNMHQEIEGILQEIRHNLSQMAESNGGNIGKIRRNSLPLAAPLGSCSNKSDFADFVRYGADNKKSLHEGDGEHGGFLIPAEIVTRIDDQLKLFSPFRTIAKAITISTNAIDILVDIGTPDAGWMGAQDHERLETDTATLRKINIPVHEIYAKPLAHQQLLDDTNIDVENWIVKKIAEKMAHLEDAAFINGTGEDQPRGFLRCESSAALERDFGVLQHFSTGAVGRFADNTTAISLLIDMTCSLKPKYVKNACWVLSRSALAEIRKLKDRDGRHLWQPAISESTPATLLGFPVIVDDNMPQLIPDQASIPVAFGDFSAGYQIVDRQNLTMLRDPYSSKPFVEFYISKRVGGDVIDHDAIKLLKFDVEAQ